MTAQSIFEELRFIWELLAADFIFLLPFAKLRRHFLPLVLLGLPILSLLSLIHFPLLELGSSLPGIWRYGAVSSGYIVLAVTTMLFSRLCFSLTVSDALYFCTAGYAAQHFVYVLVHEVLARMVWPSLPRYIPLYVFVCLGGCCLFFVPMYLTFSPRLAACDGRMFEDKPSRIGANLFLLIVLMFCTFACQHLFEFVEEVRMLGAVLGGMVSFLILSVQYQTLAAVRSGQERAVIEQMLRDSERHYTYSRELIDMVNRTVHDLKHTLRALRHTDEGERQRFIGETEASLQEYQRLVYSDNEVLNTILAEKAFACERRAIRFSCSVDRARLDFLSVPDLYALLGNAIDNAIEGVEGFPDPDRRVVSLTIRSQSGFVCIQTNNCCGTLLAREDGLPLTTKADRASHGFGLKSIRYLAQKYGGAMCVSVQDGVFILQIMLPEPART
ncbi:MAG: sensor histidine kinase [Oscillospiraceae bacterium]|jgi:uncharacterized membrane protein required for colicin V production|nr:sensor histidine kinase [Oscillospiraceae bacterium]